jgi:uncharacterized protein with GYD domain
LKDEGEHGIVVITELPNMAEVTKASVTLKEVTDITFFTVAAMPIDECDRLFGGA